MGKQNPKYDERFKIDMPFEEAMQRILATIIPCDFGRAILGLPGVDVERCPKPAARGIALHVDAAEEPSLLVQLCEEHAVMVESITTPHQEP